MDSNGKYYYIDMSKVKYFSDLNAKVETVALDVKAVKTVVSKTAVK